MLVVAVAPAVRRRGDDAMMRLIARRFGLGSAAALALAVGTGVAMASHFSRWSSNILQVKLMLLVLVGVLTGLHVVSPETRAVAYGIVASSLLVLWLGVKLTYG
jgi:hypothetical protein